MQLDPSNFLAALRSVGTAATMASAGIYLHRQQYLTPDHKKVLALISQQVTIPALLFSKIVYCKQDSSTEACPHILDLLENASVLLLWPCYTVGWGLIVAWIIIRLVNTPKGQRSLVYASCALGNSTGLPITLLAVIHANFPPDTEIGRVDPALFLSVYLLTYPMLQWGVGSFLLSSSDKDAVPDGKNDDIKYMDQDVANAATVSLSFRSIQPTTDYESQMASNQSLSSGKDDQVMTERDALLGGTDSDQQTKPQSPKASHPWLLAQYHRITSILSTLQTMISKSLAQPPVIGSMLGFALSAWKPLRGLFVDLVDRNDSAPFEWFFDGIYSVGQAAVPINMIILGVNLSKAFDGSSIQKAQLLPVDTTISIVVGKMIVMPIIGISSVCVLNYYLLNIPEGVDGPLYLVMMIVFITPTANNVMVMLELTNSVSKEGLARLIAWQYLLAPLLLTINLAVIVSLVSQW